MQLPLLVFANLLDDNISLIPPPPQETDVRLIICNIYLSEHYVLLFVCLFSWRYNPLRFYFQSPVADFSLLVFKAS